MSDITQIITELPDAPSRQDPTNFADDADSFVAALEDLPGEVNTWAEQANDLKDEVNDLKSDTEAARDSAISGTNFQGTWSSTVTYDQYVSVKYNNRIWGSLVSGNLNHTPAEGSYWTLLAHCNYYLATRYEMLPIEWAEDGTSSPESTETITVNNKIIRVRKFDGVSQNEDVTFIWLAPTELYSAGDTQIRIVFLVTESTEPSAEGVVFKVEVCSISDNDSIDGTYGTASNPSKTNLTASQYDLIYTTWVDLNSITAGNLHFIKLSRLQDNINDTYEQDIGVAFIEIKYTEEVS